MHTKQNIGIFILIFGFTVALAQRPIDNRVEVEKSEPPVYYLPKSVNSMGIDIQMDKQVNFQLSFMDVKKAIYDAVQLPIAQEVYSVEGTIRDALDLIISVQIGSCKRISIEDMTNANGGKYWTGSVTFPLNVSWKFKEHPNDNFTKAFSVYSEDGAFHFESQHYLDREKMLEARMSDMAQGTLEYFNMFLDELRRDNEPYYPKVLDKYFISLYTLKDKKIDFSPVDKAFEIAKAGLEMTNPEDYKPESVAAEKVKEAIAAYQDILENGETGKNGAHYLYSNLIQLQLEIGEFTEGKKSIEEMKDLGGMSKMVAKMMEGTLEDTKRKYEQAGIAYN